MAPEANLFRQVHLGLEGPAWRWQQAKKLAACKHPRDCPDPLVNEAAKYLREMAGARISEARASPKYGLIAEAARIAEEGGLAAKLKILTLGRIPQAEIAERLELAEPAVFVWEDLFFDVRDCLAAIDWLDLFVFRRQEARDPGNQRGDFKLAYVGGPVAARALLDAVKDLPLTAGARLIAAKLKLLAKTEQASRRLLQSGEDAARLVRLSADIRAEEKRLELDARKLEERCREAQRRHERQVLRLQYQILREKRRAKEKRHAEEKRHAAQREQPRLASCCEGPDIVHNDSIAARECTAA